MLLGNKTILKMLVPLCALSLLACSGEDGKGGEDGNPGEDGDAGDDGANGQDGDDGDAGRDGDDGEKGSDGEPGDDGAPGATGRDGVDGYDSLIRQTQLAPGSTCLSGGLKVASGPDWDENGSLEPTEVSDTNYLCHPGPAMNFNRVAVFPVCSQIDAACDTDEGTAAEIVAVSEDGQTLVYSDSPAGVVGFVDITDPSSPAPLDTLDLGGEPTSVSVVGDYALVGVNTSPDYDNPSGHLEVVQISTQTSVVTHDLGGQPDSVAVSPDGSFAVIAIENERDEDEADGELPQAPAGSVVVIDLAGAPATWVPQTIDLTGADASLVDVPSDPEPEFVDINSDNVAVVTLQENNALVLLDLTATTITPVFYPAGSVDLDATDTQEEGVISMDASLSDVPREPDGVSWIGTEYFATADEGDLYGGSRGFTVFKKDGTIVYSSGNLLDHLTARLGHYPEGRSENKGNEPENIEYGEFGGEKLLFVNSERASLVFVFDVEDPMRPVFRQALPAGVAPEGGLAIPSRNLLVVASEEDARENKIRSVLNVYEYQNSSAQYPTLVSADRADETPIPWAALSGLAASTTRSGILYSIEDSAFGKSRIFTIDVTSTPARLIEETRIVDENDVLAGLSVVDVDDSADEDDATRIDVFDDVDLAALINSDKTVNLDPEGIAPASAGGFWLASEGAGTVGDAEQPVNSLNLLLHIAEDGVIQKVVTLPDAVNDTQLRFGYEGVAEYDGKVYVAFQRIWNSESGVRIGIYDISAETWEFVYYPLDAVASQYGGWVGLSDLTSRGDGTFLVVERDNQGGPDAAIKKLYSIDLSSATDGDTITKSPVRDLMGDLAARGGPIPEKIEGSAVDADGYVWIVNDNDGVEDNSGETQLLNLGALL